VQKEDKGLTTCPFSLLIPSFLSLSLVLVIVFLVVIVIVFPIVFVIMFLIGDCYCSDCSPRFVDRSDDDLLPVFLVVTAVKMLHHQSFVPNTLPYNDGDRSCVYN
jgi:hypothetical protein